MVAVRADTRKVYPKYLLAALRSKVVQDQISQMHVGTLIPHFKKGDFDKLLIPVPTPYDQQFIGDTYFELSAKIDLNRKMNETLEGIARAIFKSWFVDFDPVRAKAQGRDPGLPSDLADLFPSSFVNSELGEIPTGWRVKLVGDSVTCVKGKSYSSAELQSSTTALVTLKSFARGGGYRPEGLKPYTGAFKAEQEVRPGDLVIACTDVTQAAEVIGRPALVESSEEFESLVASLDVIIVRPKSTDVSVPFLYCLFRTDAFKSHTYAHSTGTTVLHLSNGAVPSFNFVMPAGALARRFELLSVPLFQQIDINQRESRLLGALRDSLLPKLICGELRVPDAERIVGRCV
jgi:type I restriction enzyme S subunit